MPHVSLPPIPAGRQFLMRRSLFRKLVSQRCRTAFALLDQAMVSGTSFLTTVIVGRYCGADELGQFALAMSVVLFAMGVQTSLVSTPYTVFRYQSPDRARYRAKCSRQTAGLLGLLILVLSIPVAMAIVTIPSIGAPPQLGFVLLAALPCILAREFGRRFEFAQMRMHSAFGVDALVMVIQLALLGSLAVTDKLSSPTALVCVGCSCLVSAVVWNFGRRRAFDTPGRITVDSSKQNWTLGKWLLTDHVICFAQMYVMHWFLSIMLSSSATGILAACATVASLANPVLQGLGNYLAPRFAETVGSRSKQKTLNLYWKSTGVLAVSVSIFTGLVVFFGAFILEFLYRDPTYSGQATVLTILALRLICSIPTIAADHAVVAMQAPRLGVASTLAGLIVTAVSGIPFVVHYGIVGAACAMLLGTFVEGIVLVWLFFRRLGQHDWEKA